MVIIVMGVCGSGKSTVGSFLAEKLGCSFFDADNFHPKANVEKMARGGPLNDEDREPWLVRLNEKIAQCSVGGTSAVLACSALKESYRDILSKDIKDLSFVYLKGDYKTIYERMASRDGHFMGEDMVQSQFDTLDNGIGSQMMTGGGVW
jgi:gluconokinase